VTAVIPAIMEGQVKVEGRNRPVFQVSGGDSKSPPQRRTILWKPMD
jgi:hypothetical protein